jgi:hypothetical protein
METPAPVDLSKLKAILGNAKKVMKAVEEKSPTKKSNDSVNESYSNSYSESSTPIYSEADEREPNYGIDYSQYTTEAPSQGIQHRDYTEEDVMNSKLPPIIKEAMLKNPIPKASMSFSKFSLEGLEDLIEKPVKKPVPQFKSPSVPLIESAGNNNAQQMITISLPELNKLIENKVNEMLAKQFVKMISEQSIKKTINTLISEGKLPNKKK